MFVAWMRNEVVRLSNESSPGKSVTMTDGIVVSRVVEVHLAGAVSKENSTIIIEVGTATSTSADGTVALGSSATIRGGICGL